MAVSHSGVWNDLNMLKKLLVSGVLVAGSLGLTMTRSGANGHGANPAPSAVCAADCTVTVPYSKYPRYFWVAPAGVTSITFDVRGADGGSSQTDCPSPCTITAGGRGGRITGTLAVTPGKTYYFLIGGSGQNFAGPQGASPKGGYNGGGGAGGGGSSYADRTVATVATNEQGFVDSTRNGAIIISWPNMNT